MILERAILDTLYSSNTTNTRMRLPECNGLNEQILCIGIYHAGVLDRNEGA